MTQINGVADIRVKAQLNPEDRHAIRRSILMALIGVTAVAAAALLPTTDKLASTEPRTSASQTMPVQTPAASPEPTEAIGASPSLQLTTPPGEKIEMSSH